MPDNKISRIASFPNAERFVYSAAIIAIVIQWTYKLIAGDLWLGTDDMIRLSLDRFILLGHFPFGWGKEWLPGTCLYQSLWGLIFPGKLHVAVLLSSLAAYLVALHFARLCAEAMGGGVLARSLVSAGFALSPIGIRLSASAMSEPLYMAVIFAMSYFLVKIVEPETERSRLWMLAVPCMILAGFIRVEGWWVSFIAAAGIGIIMIRRKSPDRRWIVLLLASFIAPAAWTFKPFFEFGNPLHHFDVIAQMHKQHYAGWSYGERLSRLLPFYRSNTITLHLAGMVGAALALRGWKRGRGHAPLLLLLLASYSFILITAITASYTSQPLDRFIVIPVLLSLPFAGRVVSWMPSRSLRICATSALVIVTLFEWNTERPDREVVRQEIGLNLAEMVANEYENSGNEKGFTAAFVSPVPYLSARIHTLINFVPGCHFVIVPQPEEASASDVVGASLRIGATVILLDTNMVRAKSEFESSDLKNESINAYGSETRWVPGGTGDGFQIIAMNGMNPSPEERKP